jgi:hypothetical protein
MNVKNEGDLPRICEDSVDGLTGQHRVQILAFHRRPRQTVLNDVTSVVFIFFVHEKSVDKPPN